MCAKSPNLLGVRLSQARVAQRHLIDSQRSRRCMSLLGLVHSFKLRNHQPVISVRGQSEIRAGVHASAPKVLELVVAHLAGVEGSERTAQGPRRVGPRNVRHHWRKAATRNPYP